MELSPPVTRVVWRDTARLIPSRYPSVGLFDGVASRDDLELVLELESWTNDRISNEVGLLHAVDREEWVAGRPMASVIMAAFCHPHPAGSRFSSAQRGAWYAGRKLDTAIAESVYHRGRELKEIGVTDARMEMRLYQADFRTTFHDLRSGDAEYRPLLHPDSYAASQSLAAQLLAAESHGVVYPSVRHRGGECVACFRPPLVTNVRAAAHYVFVWEGTPEPRVTRLQAHSG
jgi:hypothetical protein